MVRSQTLREMTIGMLAKAGGVGVETIRYYQRRGLLSEPPRAGGVRRYGVSDIRRLRFIRGAQQAGFSLTEIGELIELDASEDRARARELAERRIAAIDAEIERLSSARLALHGLATRCADGEGDACPILQAFEPHGCG